MKALVFIQIKEIRNSYSAKIKIAVYFQSAFNSHLYNFYAMLNTDGNYVA